MKRSIWLTGGIVALVLLLGGAAFVGGRLLGGPDSRGEGQDFIVSGSDDVKSGTGTLLDVEPAGEMPDTPADVAGSFVRREDNSLFVGTGNMSGVKVGDKWEIRYDGPEVEIVTTHDTLIYRDNMFEQLGGAVPKGPLKQVLKPGTLDEIDESCTLQAWGERRSDRLVAQVLVYAPNPDF